MSRNRHIFKLLRTTTGDNIGFRFSEPGEPTEESLTRGLVLSLITLPLIYPLVN